VSQIFIDGGEFRIIHSPEQTPWHLLAEVLGHDRSVTRQALQRGNMLALPTQ
jgi:hypothetical protein